MRHPRLGLVCCVMALMVVGCNASSSKNNHAEPTIAAYQTRVTELEAENAELGTAVAEIRTYFGIGETPTTVAEAFLGTPTTKITDGTVYRYGDWSFTFERYRVTEQLELPAEDSYWEADDRFHVFEIRVENQSLKSAPFPRSAFVVTEQFGSIYHPRQMLADNELLNDDADLIPGNVYTLWLVYDIPDEASGLVFRSSDGAIAASVTRDATVAFSTPVPAVVIGDGQTVRIDGFDVRFTAVTVARMTTADWRIELSLIATNKAPTVEDFPYMTLMIEDASGNYYAPMDMTFPDEGFETFQWRGMGPGEQAYGRLVFLVPANAPGLVLTNSDRTITVAIPEK